MAAADPQAVLLQGYGRELGVENLQTGYEFFDFYAIMGKIGVV